MKAKKLQELIPKGADAVYAKTSRRGFLARTSALLAAIGLGEVGLSGTAQADPLCCTGTACSDLGAECTCGDPFPIHCPTGWTYTGYTWACCLSSDTLFMCRDCQKHRHVCVCGCQSNFNCQSTLTELEAMGVKLGPPK